MRLVRKVAAVAVLTLATLMSLLLVSPSANASVITRVATGSGDKNPAVALASTGLDITTPVIIGLATLVLGIALVCWAFLRGGSAGRRQSHPRN